MVTYMYIVHVQCNSLLTLALLHLWAALKTFNPSFRRKNSERRSSRFCSVRVVLAVLLHVLPCRMWNSFHLVSTSLSSLCFRLPSTFNVCSSWWLAKGREKVRTTCYCCMYLWLIQYSFYTQIDSMPKATYMSMYMYIFPRQIVSHSLKHIICSCFVSCGTWKFKGFKLLLF